MAQLLQAADVAVSLQEEKREKGGASGEYGECFFDVKLETSSGTAYACFERRQFCARICARIY